MGVIIYGEGGGGGGGGGGDLGSQPLFGSCPGSHCTVETSRKVVGSSG